MEIRNLIHSIEVNSVEKAEEILKAAGTEDLFEKAKVVRQDGDMHPNGKWVWRSSANKGKGDWRVYKGNKDGSVKTNASSNQGKKQKESRVEEKDKTYHWTLKSKSGSSNSFYIKFLPSVKGEERKSLTKEIVKRIINKHGSDVYYSEVSNTLDFNWNKVDELFDSISDEFSYSRVERQKEKDKKSEIEQRKKDREKGYQALIKREKGASEFIDEFFPNTLDSNKYKLIKYLIGEDKTFNGVVNRSWEQGLRKLDALKEDYKIDFSKIKKAYVKKVSDKKQKEVAHGVIKGAGKNAPAVTPTKTQPKADDKVTIKTFEKIASESDSVKDFISNVRKINNVPELVSTEFFRKYADNGKLDIFQASEKFMKKFGKKYKENKRV